MILVVMWVWLGCRLVSVLSVLLIVFMWCFGLGVGW